MPDPLSCNKDREFNVIFLDPTLIGGPQADRKISKLGDVMCVTGLAVEFYELGRDREKYEKIRLTNLHKMEPIPVCIIPR